jgi:Mn-containing catalase
MNSANMPPSETEARLASIRHVVEDAEERKSLAYFVRGHVQKQAKALQEKENELQQRELQVKRFSEHLRKLGISWDETKSDWRDSQSVDKAITELKQAVDVWHVRQIRDTGQKMMELATTLENYI